MQKKAKPMGKDDGKPITKNKIAFMVNIDQIGSTLEPLNKDRKDFIIMLGGNSFRKSYDNVLENVTLAPNLLKKDTPQQNEQTALKLLEQVTGETWDLPRFLALGQHSRNLEKQLKDRFRI